VRDEAGRTSFDALYRSIWSGGLQRWRFDDPSTASPNGFSKASLNGQYAFIMTGQAADGFGLMRIGTFVADGTALFRAGPSW